MATETTRLQFDRDTVFRDLVDILKNMTIDWDTDFQGEIAAETRVIADLGFESIDVVQLVVAIEERFQRRDLPFMELLMTDGRYVDELRVGDTADFLVRHLNRS